MSLNEFGSGAVLLPYEFDEATLLYGDLKGVIDHHDKSKSTCPGYLSALYDLRSGVVLHMAWTISKMMHHYATAIGLPPGQYVPLTLLHASLGGLDPVKNGLRYLESALDTNPTLGEALYHKGLILAALNNHEDAIQAYQAASSLVPAIIPNVSDIIFESRVLFDCGKSLEACERFTEASHCYERAIELQPDFPDAQRRYAICLQRAGKWGAAALHFDRAMICRPILPTLPRLPERIVPASDRKTFHPPQYRSDLHKGFKRASYRRPEPGAIQLARRVLAFLRRRIPPRVKHYLRPYYIILRSFYVSVFRRKNRRPEPGAIQLARRVLAFLRRRIPPRVKHYLRPYYIILRSFYVSVFRRKR